MISQSGEDADYADRIRLEEYHCPEIQDELSFERYWLSHAILFYLVGYRQDADIGVPTVASTEFCLPCSIFMFAICPTMLLSPSR